jgi:cytochrome c5
VTNKAGKTTLENAYHQEEFIASSDMNFRPVNTYTGPDGCLYIVDMNRGIIQEGTWTGPESYLRAQILRLGLDKNKQRGRIYRLVYDGLKPGPKPQLLKEPAATLVTYLDHPNGWWRDNAQKELVVRGEQSVVPVLKQMAAGLQGALPHLPSALGRLHALWTLEGLAAVDKEILFKALQDDDAQVRRAAIWISEPYVKQNDEQVIEKLAALQNDASYDVLTQLLLSLQYSTTDRAHAVVKELLAQNASNEMLSSVQKSIERNAEVEKFGLKLGSLDVTSRKMILNGATTFRSLCATCHGTDGKGLPSQLAPPLVGNFRRMVENKDAMIRIVLHGLSGPVEGKTYPDVMPPMGANDDEWIASVLSYIRYDLGLSERGFPGLVSPEFLSRIIVKPEEVKKAREQTAGRTTTWTWDELEKARRQ